MGAIAACDCEVPSGSAIRGSLRPAERGPKKQRLLEAITAGSGNGLPATPSHPPV